MKGNVKTPTTVTDTNRSKRKKKMHGSISTRTTNAQSYKGKNKVGEFVGRPPRNRKPSARGIRLYTNLKTRQQTYYAS